MSDSSSLGHRAVFLHAVPGTDAQFPSIKETLAKKLWHIVVKVGQAWDLGHFAAAPQCLHLGTALLSNETHRNYMGLKITASMHRWGKFWTKKTKKEKKKSNCHFSGARSKDGVLEANVGYCACPPACNTTKRGVSRPRKPPLQPNPWTDSYPAPCKIQACPYLGSQQVKEPVINSHSPVLPRGPSKSCLNFPVWPLVNFCQSRKARTLVSIKDKLSKLSQLVCG